MNHANAAGSAHDPQDGWLSRERSLALLLIAASAIIGYFCYRIVEPFLPAMAWALALAVTAHPLHQRIRKIVPWPSLAAFATVVLVAVALVCPVVFVTHQLVHQAGEVAKDVQEKVTPERLQSLSDKYPRLTPLIRWTEMQLGIDPSDPTENPGKSNGAPSSPPAAPQAAGFVAAKAATVACQVGSALLQVVLSLFMLFFFLRDRRLALDAIRSSIPLSPSESDRVFVKISDTIHATVFGSVVVAIVQGTMGGLMFWWLGLPAPLVWGTVMAVLATIPVLGTFVIWAPTAVFLAFQGNWRDALILAAWGGLAIGLIDNLLYPFLVGKRVRRHTLLVFLFLVGGLALCGASGVVLGPVTLAIAQALIEVWRHRTEDGGVAEAGVNG